IRFSALTRADPNGSTRRSKDARLLKSRPERPADVRCAGLKPCANDQTARLISKLQIFNLQSLFLNALALVIFACLSASVRGEVRLPQPNRPDSITISSETANRWKSGTYDVWLLRGNCVIKQGAALSRSREAVLWIEQTDRAEKLESKVISYMEGSVELAQNGLSGPVKLNDQSWFGQFITTGEIQVYAAQVAGEPVTMPSIYQRALERRHPLTADTFTRSEARPTQFTTPVGPPEIVQTPPAAPLPQGRRIRVFPRSDVPVQAQWFPDPHGGNLWIAVIDSGVNMVVDRKRTSLNSRHGYI